MKRMVAAACGLVFAAALAGCGSTTDNLDFKVPPGYTSKMSMAFLSVWTKGTDADKTSDVLMLMKLPVKMDEAKFESNTFTSSGGMKDAKVESTQKITICGNQSAMLVKATGTSEQAKGKEMDVDMLVTPLNGNTYMAMYLYPHGGAADPAGLAAIKSVCAKSAT